MASAGRVCIGWVSGRVAVLIKNPQAAPILSPTRHTSACDPYHPRGMFLRALARPSGLRFRRVTPPTLRGGEGHRLVSAAGVTFICSPYPFRMQSRLSFAFL